MSAVLILVARIICMITANGLAKGLSVCCCLWGAGFNLATDFTEFRRRLQLSCRSHFSPTKVVGPRSNYSSCSSDAAKRASEMRGPDSPGRSDPPGTCDGLCQGGDG